MKLQTIPSGSLNPVDGVFGTNPVVKGEPVELGRPRRRGVAELLQGGRVIAISATKPLLLSFAAINNLPVINHTEKQPSFAPANQQKIPVFCLD